MHIQQFLQHHGLKSNPFSDEDAQTDSVFKDRCISETFHPTWDKVYGNPLEPATSIVFGEKGAGKTAMRLQIAKHIEKWNDSHPNQRLFVAHYDDFNPFLDRFALRAHRRRTEKVLQSWRLWDHIDAILSVSITGIVDKILQTKSAANRVEFEVSPGKLGSLSRFQARDLLLLAACYDQSTSETYKSRWNRLRKAIGFRVWKSYWDFSLGVVWTLFYVGMLFTLWYRGWENLSSYWILHLILILAGWAPNAWRALTTANLAWRVVRRVRTGNLAWTQVYQVLRRFMTSELASQPLPAYDRCDDRYELLQKLQDLLTHFGYKGMVVIIDRVDEPHLINGSPELMKLLVWPMLDNKFLKHAGLGLKMMLPIELLRYVEREEGEFHQRARLDKQNLVTSFNWTPEALLDVVNARIHACSTEGKADPFRKWLGTGVSDRRVLEAFTTIRVPRHVFKFIYRLLVAHCNAHSAENPSYEISAETFESTLALYVRDQKLLEAAG